MKKPVSSNSRVISFPLNRILDNEDEEESADTDIDGIINEDWTEEESFRDPRFIFLKPSCKPWRIP